MSRDWVGKRKAERTSLNLKAVAVFFDDALPPLDVLVTDISRSGARVAFPTPGPHPDEFRLEIPARDQKSIVRVRWQNDGQAGVEFVASRAGDSIESLLTRVRSMERRFVQFESAAPGVLPTADASPLLERIDTIEQRLAQLVEARVPEPDAPGIALVSESEARMLDRIEALERRLGEVVAASAGSNEIVDRLTRLEWRFDEIGRTRRPEVASAPDFARQMLFFGERLAALETEMRAQVSAPPQAAADAAGAGAPDVDALAKRLDQVERDLRGAIDLVSDMQADGLASDHKFIAQKTAPDLEREVAQLRASVETLVLAVSVGLGRGAA